MGCHCLLRLLPYHAPNNYNPVTRGKQGFGSTGDQVVCFTQQILSDRPTCKVKIQGKTFSDLLDTGADFTIITSHQWPDDWPLTEPQGKISGLGEPTACSEFSNSSLPRARQTTLLRAQQTAYPVAPSSLQQGKGRLYDGENRVTTRKRARKNFTGRSLSFTYSTQTGQKRASI